MDQDPAADPARPYNPADDPEIAALLNFTAVPRRIERPDGWGAAEQRGYVAWLAATGSAVAAANAVGRSESGARQVRREDVRGEFKAACKAALALYRARQAPADAPPLAPPPRARPQPCPAPRHAREVREARAFGKEAELEEAEKEALLAEIIRRYEIKLQSERRARLEGRITEADFYVRQLTHIELILDIGGRTQALLDGMKQDDLHLPQVSATPGSTLLEKLRRALWLEKGEADRPPPAPLGHHNERYATGADRYDPDRDGDWKEWERKQAEKQKLAAEAQAEWEARARGEAENGNDEPEPPPQ